MTKDELKARTKKFSIEIVFFVRELPPGQEGDVFGRQLLRAGTAVAANYRSACRAKSQADFISKIGTVEEEADESAFWLEVIIETGLSDQPKTHKLLKEANELTAIFTATGRTSKENSGRYKQP